MAASEGLPLLQTAPLSPRSAAEAEAEKAKQRKSHRRRLAVAVTLLLILAIGFIAHAHHFIKDPWNTGTAASPYAEVMADYRATSDFDGVVQVSENGVVTYADWSGRANEEFDAPITHKSMFPIGSNSKLFTSVSLYQLQERGLVNLSEPVNGYLGQEDFANFGFPNQTEWCPRVKGAAPDSPCENITFVQLMYMGSGIGDSLNCDNVDPAYCHLTADNYGYYKGSIGAHVGVFINDPLVFKPNTNYSYANPNYYLLSYMVEKISGQSLEEYLDKNIFQKLGLQDSYYDPYSGVHGIHHGSVDEYIHYYAQSAGGQRPELLATGTCSPGLNSGSVSGAGGLQASVPDMHKWFLDLFGSRGTASKLLTAESVRMLIDRVNPFSPPYGQGIGVGARLADGWPSQLTYCGGVKCTTTCNALVFTDGKPEESAVISVYSNHRHAVFTNRTAFEEYQPNGFLFVATEVPSIVASDEGGAIALPTPLARAYLAKHNSTSA